MFKVRTEDFIEFDYVNWKGESSHRQVEVLGFVYGSNEWHKEEQWLLRGYDMDKNDFRVFATKDMSNVKKF